ncbi:Rad51 family protein [Babesia bovis T2Bo]|uniref:RecA family profile 1 domain-containing protein n=1 Tax=Babesia bovis TaxID=5865 RepID=A7AT31_BABBO|nr:Rad51 family protein [Babesia bovis T2Bo]EDO06092.1 Rad51 family protein [Babesia bovis T2Bo]|eukprot:XP_001609660.1 hypothetical protein [Babesia bovis T2Bo]
MPPHTTPSFTESISLGITEIDDALGDCLLLGMLTEIYGESGSGKTQVALTLVAEELVRMQEADSNDVMLYFQTSRAFPMQRFCDIIEHKRKSKNSRFKGAPLGPREIAKHLRIYRPSEPTLFLEELRNLHADVGASYHIRLIVIDSIACLFGDCMEDKDADNASMNTLLNVASILKRLAHQKNALILLINEAIAGNLDASAGTGMTHTLVTPALGDLWSQAINCRILIEAIRSSSSTRRFLRILFNCNGPPSIPLDFKIAASGIRACRVTHIDG